MQVSQSYGVRRVAEIAAKVAKCRAALPVASTVPALIESPAIDAQTAPIEAPTETRAPFVIEFPREREAHRKAQTRLFAAVKDAGLSTNLTARMAGINSLLGLNLTSSTALTPSEMHWVADAIGANRFASDWQLNAAPEVDDEPFLVEAPPEVETAPETGTTPAPLESLDEVAMEFDLAQMRAVNRARQRTAIYAEKVLLETRLNELEHALLCA